MQLLMSGIEDYMLPCLNKTFLGFECMGCGLQRSIFLLIKGQFVDAFIMYPAIYPMLFLFVFLIFDRFTTIKHGEKAKLILAALTLLVAVTSYIIKMFVH